MWQAWVSTAAVGVRRQHLLVLVCCQMVRLQVVKWQVHMHAIWILPSSCAHSNLAVLFIQSACLAAVSRRRHIPAPRDAASSPAGLGPHESCQLASALSKSTSWKCAFCGSWLTHCSSRFGVIVACDTVHTALMHAACCARARPAAP